MVTSDGLVKIEGVSFLLATRGSGRARLGRRLFACVFSVRALLLLEKHWQGAGRFRPLRVNLRAPRAAVLRAALAPTRRALPEFAACVGALAQQQHVPAEEVV